MSVKARSISRFIEVGAGDFLNLEHITAISALPTPSVHLSDGRSWPVTKEDYKRLVSALDDVESKL